MDLDREASPYKRLGLNKEQFEELEREFTDKAMGVPSIIDLLDWITDNYEGKERDALLIMYGRMLVINDAIVGEMMALKQKLPPHIAERLLDR